MTIASLFIVLLVMLFTGSAKAADLVQITDFGDNPSDLKMFLYVPDNVDPDPAVLVAIHYCGGSGTEYYNVTQWDDLADEHGFIVIYPSVGDGDTCYDPASTESLTHNGGSDSLAIVNMVNYVLANHDAHPDYVYAVGSSSGAMMTNVLLAIYPDVFNAGAAFAGVPATCFFTGTASIWNPTCAQGNLIQTPQEWGDAVRNGYPGYTGPYPRMQIWHGTNDASINYANFGEAIKLWTNLHGLSQTPDSTDTPETDWTRTRYGGTDSQPLVEAISLAGYPHTLPRGANGLEPYAFDFLGIGDPRPTGPTVTPGGPTVTPAPTATPLPPTATLDPSTLLNVEAFIDNQTDQLTLYKVSTINDSVSSVTDVTVRIYVDLSEGVAPTNVETTLFWNPCNVVASGPVAVVDSTYYFEFDFGSTPIPAGGSCQFTARINTSNWSRIWDGSNDYSAENLTGTYAATDNITAYANGTLASGIEPFTAAPVATATPVPTSTPTSPATTPVATSTPTVPADTTLIYRSEYEQIGDEIHDFDHSLEGSVTYHIVSGNDDGHYTLNQTTGKLTIAQTIPDQFDVVTQHDLMIEVRDGDAIFEPLSVSVVDGYDYQLSLGGYTQILADHADTAFNGEWTAYNNLWGRGDAVPNQDFRSAILITDSMPQETIFLWDTPGTAADFNGASVWNYINLFYGNRTGERDDLPGFPIRIDDMTAIPMQFDYEQLFGDDRYKVAFNMFLTDEETLQPFGSNDGDFFMVFDQVGTWVPPYPVDLGDITIEGLPFTRIYKEANGYEWRRVIITDDNSLTSASFDLLDYFDMFADAGYLDKSQSISHMMFGLEITEGFGGLQVNTLSIDVQTEDTQTPLAITLAPHNTPASTAPSLLFTVVMLIGISVAGRFAIRSSRR